MDFTEHIQKEINEMRGILLELKDDIFDLLELIDDLTDKDECDLDHHGNCQTHGWTVGESDNRECPHKRAKELLAREKFYKREMELKKESGDKQ